MLGAAETHSPAWAGLRHFSFNGLAHSVESSCFWPVWPGVVQAPWSLAQPCLIWPGLTWRTPTWFSLVKSGLLWFHLVCYRPPGLL